MLGRTSVGTSTWTELPPDARKAPDGVVTSATVRPPASCRGSPGDVSSSGAGGVNQTSTRAPGAMSRDGARVRVIDTGRRSRSVARPHRGGRHELTATDGPHDDAVRGDRLVRPQVVVQVHGPEPHVDHREVVDRDPVARHQGRPGHVDRDRGLRRPHRPRAQQHRRGHHRDPGQQARVAPARPAQPRGHRRGQIDHARVHRLSWFVVPPGAHPAVRGTPRREHCGQTGPGATACHTAVMPSRFLTLADVTEVLNISAPQAYALVRSGELPAIQIGGRLQWRVESTELEKYIQRMYEQTRARISSDGTTIDDAASD